MLPILNSTAAIGFPASATSGPSMFYGANLGGAGGLCPVLQPTAPPQILVESALLRGARLAAAIEPVADVPGSEDPDY